MRIGFNGQRLAGQRLGVGRYIEYMLRYWSAMLDSSEQVDLFLRRPLDEAAAGDMLHSRSIRPRVLGPDRRCALGKRAASPGGGEHRRPLCPAYTAPVSYPGRLVVATHSVNEIQATAHDWLAPAKVRPSVPPLRAAGRRGHRTCGNHQGRHCAPLRRAAGSNRRDSAGGGRLFPAHRDESGLIAVRRRFFGTNRPFILFVGKGSARRNIPMLLRSFAKLRRENTIPHALLLFGPTPRMFPSEGCARSWG